MYCCSIWFFSFDQREIFMLPPLSPFSHHTAIGIIVVWILPSFLVLWNVQGFSYVFPVLALKFAIFSKDLLVLLLENIF